MSFTVYRSSAGSGKTFTLVKAYLRIALGSHQVDSYRHILAITFTNKAANEMKERVISSLRALGAKGELEGGSAQLLEILAKETKLPGELLRERAAHVLEHLLHHYSDFSVSTIDKFVHRVVRTFANDLRIPYNFEVELDASNLLSKAIDMLISHVGEDEKLTQALVDFTESKADDEKSWHIEADLYRFAFNLLSEDGHEHLKKIRKTSLEDFFQLRKKLQEQLKALEKKYRDLGEEALSLIKNESLNPAAFAGGARSGLPAFFAYLASGRMDKTVPSATLLKYMEEGKLQSAKASPVEIAALEKLAPELNRHYREALELNEVVIPTYNLYILIHRNVYPLGVLNEIEKIMEEFKEENNLLHISEFNKKIAEIVAEEPAPFIYERLGERYKHYLIDEFQDTSVLQWQNLLPLVENALASGHYNMVVGDGKQSIYRWRGGEVEQFAQLPDVFGKKDSAVLADRERVLHQHFQEEHLNVNFRSKEQVVTFNNIFFTHLSTHLDNDFFAIYKDVAQKVRPGNNGGLARIEVLDPEEPDETEAMFQRIETTINSCREDGYSLGDITILCRRNHEASMIAEHLLSVGIDIISSESLMLASSEKVAFLISFIRYLSDPQNLLYLAELTISTQSSGLMKEPLHPYLEQLKEEGDAFSFEAFFGAQGYPLDLERLTQLPLYEAVEELMRIFNFNDPPSPFLNFFLDFVYAYTTRQNDNPGDFLERWEEKKEKLSIVMPEGVEAVQIMTIHKSKGLEFPVVIFPFANWKVQNAKSDLWIELPEEELGLESLLVPTNKLLEQTAFADRYEEETSKSLLDNFNVMYVACTRPIDRLYMFTTEPGRYHNFSGYFLGFLKEHEGWKAEESRFQMGTATPKQEGGKESHTSTQELQQMISRDWRNKIQISLKAPEVWDAENPDAEDLMRLLQSAMQNLRSGNHIEATLRSMFLEGLLTEKERDSLQSKMENLLSSEVAQQLFAESQMVRHDVEIVLPNGDSFQPDRLLLPGDKAIVITFLINTPTPSDHKKIHWCGRTLKEMGHKKVEKYFFYLDSGKIVNPQEGSSPQLDLFDLNMN